MNSINSNITQNKICGLLIKALFFDNYDEEHKALNCLAKAVQLAKESKQLDLLTHFGPKLENLITRGYAKCQYEAQLHAAVSVIQKQQNGAASSAETLTTREHQILALIGQGKSNKDIALELGIALSTVKNHARHIFAKLNASTRLQAVLNASQQLSGIDKDAV